MHCVVDLNTETWFLNKILLSFKFLFETLWRKLNVFESYYWAALKLLSFPHCSCEIELCHQKWSIYEILTMFLGPLVILVMICKRISMISVCCFTWRRSVNLNCFFDFKLWLVFSPMLGVVIAFHLTYCAKFHLFL